MEQMMPMFLFHPQHAQVNRLIYKEVWNNPISFSIASVALIHHILKSILLAPHSEILSINKC